MKKSKSELGREEARRIDCARKLLQQETQRKQIEATWEHLEAAQAGLRRGVRFAQLLATTAEPDGTPTLGDASLEVTQQATELLAEAYRRLLRAEELLALPGLTNAGWQSLNALKACCSTDDPETIDLNVADYDFRIIGDEVADYYFEHAVMSEMALEDHAPILDAERARVRRLMNPGPETEPERA